MPKAARISLPLLFIAAIYGGPLFIEQLSSDAHNNTLSIWLAAVIIISIANIANAYLKHEDNNPQRLAFWGMLLKLCMIPFYLLVFISGLAISTAMAVIPGFFLATPIVISLLVAIDYIPLLFTSSYGFVATVRSRKQNLITNTSTTILLILHALFVTDVIAAVVLYILLRKTSDA